MDCLQSLSSGILVSKVANGCRCKKHPPIACIFVVYLPKFPTKIILNAGLIYHTWMVWVKEMNHRIQPSILRVIFWYSLVFRRVKTSKRLQKKQTVRTFVVTKWFFENAWKRWCWSCFVLKTCLWDLGILVWRKKDSLVDEIDVIWWYVNRRKTHSLKITMEPKNHQSLKGKSFFHPTPWLLGDSKPFILGADSRNTVVILSGRNWEMMEDAKGQKNLSSLCVFLFF